MKVLFVQTDSLNEIVNSAMHIYNFEPLGLYYLAATIKADHDVDLIDLNNEFQITGLDTEQLFIEKLLCFKPDVVALSAFASVRTGRISQLCSITKAVDHRIVTIVGGAHASLSASDFRCDSIDLVISADSMSAFPLAIRRIEKGISKKNIQQNLDNKTDEKGSRLRLWPKPFRELGNKYRDLYRITVGRPGVEPIHQSVSSVKTSSGCPFRCSFCCLWQLYPKYQKRDVESVVSDIGDVTSEYVFLADDESMIDPRYMFDLADALKKSHVKKKFVMYARSDTLTRNPELIEKWAEAGLHQVWIGLEGATNAQLERYQKRNSTESHESAMRIARENLVRVHATALVDPTFKKEDFRYLLHYTRDILELTSCHFFVLTPFRGTHYFDSMIKSEPAKFLTQNPDHFSIRQLVLQPDHMTVQEFHQNYADLQRDFNSDTIPFSVQMPFANHKLQEEFEILRQKNEALYQAILRSDLHYN